MFVNKAFRACESRWFERIATAGLRTLGSDRIREVMKDKYRLEDKFSFIAAELDDPDIEQDLDLFRRIKGIRNDFLHGEDVHWRSLPLEGTRELLRKYLRLHVSALRDGRSNKP